MRRPKPLPPDSRLFLYAMGVGIAATLFQLLPLPQALVHVISPGTGRVLAFADESAGSRWLPLSLSPYETRFELVKQLACAAVFIVAVGLLHRPSRIRAVMRTLFL